jgi:serine/threonine-protein kinase
MNDPRAPTVVGRYVLHAPIARGGMATIHLARLLGAEGFSRMVAAKRLHPQFTENAEFLQMFLDEARIASKVHHPNVVPVLDVVQSAGEVILVQEYVHGLPLDKLLRAAGLHGELLPVGVVVAVVSDMLAGLFAAHEARDELGAPLEIVHRDVSPQNVMVGADGIARLLDFGVAKAAVNAHVTQAGMFKGKIAYTSPEQLRGVVTRATDIYAAAVVLWEALAGRRLHPGMTEAELVAVVSSGEAPTLTEAIDAASMAPDRLRLLRRLEPVVGKGMAFAAEDRYATATEMQQALLRAAPAATAAEVSSWVRRLGKEYLEGRERLIVSEESTWRQRASAVPSSLDGSDRSPRDESVGTLRPSALPILTAPARSHRAIVAMLALVGALLAGVVVLLLRAPPEPAVVAGPAPPTPPPPAPTAAATAPIAEAKAALAPSATASATASADAGALPTAMLRAPASARWAPIAPYAAPIATHAAPTHAAPAPPPANDCNPPFYFDGKKKIFKPGCL